MARKPAHLQEDTLGTLRAHAFELFGRFGYEGVSIGDIAKGAKLSKGALYWHFPGKEALYLDCLKRLHDIFNEDVFAPMRQSPDGALGIVIMFQGLVRLFADPRIQHGVAGYWLIPSTPETAELIAAQRAFESESQKAIADALRRGVAAGQLDLGDDLEDMARAIISLIEAFVLPMRHLTPDEIRPLIGVLARTLFRAYAKGEQLTALVARI
ncbi:TetR/AcrR family transcriptional regulator [Stagnimonas aquatica]|uniref:TetR/AcrR family transcriptional regulator n=1 Tax=Stagnimonas aquatica TaxID=2689987 RepID=A0A3N0VA23_9GAMM|nr:TetR/AcrR family transcriptional regulator [Stagnimonas aquatica]ROH89565.1 TetR/AcrR family transcriptional regulator [Stagnimonas aquatica]